ncbi:aminopeptidase P family protein [Sulfolobus tengchongensis]|uniref:Aminopeptidase P family protein n=1 Tax=Sulfolobus tengchongensis TaxID=207809 RepID=A0AAX4L0E8_9CREN
MNKLRKLQTILEDKKEACAVIIGSPNLFYFLEYSGVGALIYCDARFTLLAPALDMYRASNVKDVDVLIYYPSKIAENVIEGNMFKAIEKVINEKSNILLDVNWVDANTYKTLSEKYKISDISNDIIKLREIKDEDEIEKIRKAGEITSTAMKIGMERLTEEVSEKQIAGIIDMTMKSAGAEDYAFPSIVAFGENTAYPHHIPTDRVLMNNDIALFDIGAKYNGYCFDSTRTFVFKNNEAKKIYEIVLQAQLEAIDAVRDGVTASEIDNIARKVIEKAGYGKYFMHSTGHGVGVEIHESPAISMNSKQVLKENMVITVEPGIYLKGRFGIRIEDTLIVTKGKPIVLETTYKLL